MTYRFKYFFCSLLFLTQISVFAQFAPADSNLAKTAYTKQFDRQLILSYLNSNESNKNAAALLVIASSSDSSFISDIISSNFDLNPQYVCYALGTLGRSVNSAKFLLSKFLITVDNDVKRHCLEALGKTGDLQKLKFITDVNNFDPATPLPGISLCIYNFSLGKIDNIEFPKILQSVIRNPLSSTQTKAEALFTIARILKTDEIKGMKTDLLMLEKNFQKAGAGDSLAVLQFVLTAIRRGKIDVSPNLFPELFRHSSPLIRLEAVKLFAQQSEVNEAVLDTYFSIFGDVSAAASVQAAISLRDMKFDFRLKEKASIAVGQKLFSKSLHFRTEEELLKSYFVLFPEELDSFLNLNVSSIQYGISLYHYRLNPEKYSYRFKEIITKFPSFDPQMKITALETILTFSKYKNNDSLYCKFVLDQISSSEAYLCATTSEKLDSLFIVSQTKELKQRIEEQVQINANNVDFFEAIIELVKLAEKVSSQTYQNVIDKLKNSKVYSIKKYLASKKLINLADMGSKPVSNFDLLWQYSFKYKYANIRTDKGDFEIELFPNVAPISCGNFVSLATTKYFDTTNFHRVVPGFVIQGGDRSGTGFYGPGYDIVSEFSPINFLIGAVGMASAGKDTEGSQWFVMQGNYFHLVGNYTLFGKVINGIETVFNIEQNDRILSIDLR